MLVLSRKLGESIEIGNNKVIVRVLGIKQSKVQLGIDAPPDVAIHRSERADQYSRRDSEQSMLCAEGSKKLKSCDRCDRDVVLGETILEDLARVHAEISAMAELVSEQDRLVARQIAAEAVERLTAIERTVRFASRHAAEQPIATFVDSRSRALQQMHRDDSGNGDSQSEMESRSWNHRCDKPAPLIRETASSYRPTISQCAFN